MLLLLALTRYYHNQVLVEALIYSTIVEICILLIAHPYNIANYLLSIQSRWILVTVIVINTITVRTHLSIEYVVFTIIISLLALLAIYRNDRKWKAYRGYKEDEIIQKAMSMNEESSAYKSWIYHGKQQCIEMAYRVSRYSGSHPFNPNDMKTWNEVQQNIESGKPVKLKQSFVVERMIDFMRMCYCAGYLRSVSYKADLLKKTESLEEANAIIDGMKKENSNLNKQIEYMNNELLHYKEELKKADDEIDNIRQQWWDEIKNEGQDMTENKKRIAELEEYCGELEQKVDMYEREIQSLRQQIEIMEEAEVHRSEHQKAVESGKVVEIQEAKLQRASKEDAKRMRELRDEGYKIHEIAEMTGFSVSTVKRKIY